MVYNFGDATAITTFASSVQMGALTATSGDVSIQTTRADSNYYLNSTFANTGNRNWVLGTNVFNYGDFHIRQSDAQNGDARGAGTSVLWFDSAKAATFASSVSASGELLSVGSNARISLYRSAGTNFFDWAAGQTLQLGTQTSAGGAGRVSALQIDGTTLAAAFAGAVTAPTVNAGGGSCIAQLNAPTAHPYLYMYDGTYDGYIDISGGYLRMYYGGVDALRFNPSGGAATFASSVQMGALTATGACVVAPSFNTLNAKDPIITASSAPIGTTAGIYLTTDVVAGSGFGGGIELRPWQSNVGLVSGLKINHDGAATFASSVTAGSVTATGLTIQGTGNAFTSNSTGTGANFIQLVNGGGTTNLGLETSTGSYWGAAAYDFVISTPSGRGISMFIAGTGTVGRFDATGLTVPAIIKSGGTSAQYLMADGSVSSGSGGGTGATGATGATGSNIGITGVTGPTGNSGATGGIGKTGNTGSTGGTGLTGNSGATGSAGNQGNSGSTGSGGAVGLTGNSGATGVIGKTGNTGATGNSGATGGVGLTGLSGATGSVGLTGNSGTTGPTGSTGNPGTYTLTTARLMGNNSGSTTTPQEISLGTGLAWSGSTVLLDTSASVQHASLGIGNAASGTSGEIRATNNITAYYSSDRTLKENITPITNALAKVQQINGVEFDWTDAYIKAHGGEDDYFMRRHDVGVIAQEVQAVMPEVVAEREDGTLAVRYEKMIALLIEAVKEQQTQIEAQQVQIDELKAQR
jgi:hypothetical protein